MKYRESGMPDEATWNTYFNPKDVLDKMYINNGIGTIMDIGCGYGTFLLSMAERVKNVIGIDIDENMIQTCKNKLENNDINNIELINGDISTDATLNELENYKNSVDYISLFNILHCEEPEKLLKNVHSILKDDGKIGVVHWKYEDTPRGPSMEIRPTPEKIVLWALRAGFRVEKSVDLLPYHYGLIFSKIS